MNGPVMTLKIDHLHGDRWEGCLRWAEGAKRQQIGWSASREDLVDHVVEEVLSFDPVALLIDTTAVGAALYTEIRDRLLGQVVVGRLTARQPMPE